MEIIINTQEELDALDVKFNGTIYLEGGTELSPLVLRVNFEHAYVVARGKAFLTMRGSAQVGVMRGSAQVGVMRGSAQVGVMWESAQVRVMWESAQVRVMRESAQVGVMLGEAMVSCYGFQQLTCSGYNVVRVQKKNQANVTVVLNDSSHLIILPDPETTFADYRKRYPVKVDGNFATMYKAVRKDGDIYRSNYAADFTYEIGKIKTEQCDPSLDESCTTGIHVSHLSWAKNFGREWSNLAIIECRVAVDSILVSKDCDGKVRTSQIEVIRELDKSEYENI